MTNDARPAPTPLSVGSSREVEALWWGEANNARAATYRAALIEARSLLWAGRISDIEPLINRVLAPHSEGVVYVASHTAYPLLRAHMTRACASSGQTESVRVAAFVGRMVGAQPCPTCKDFPSDRR